MLSVLEVIRKTADFFEGKGIEAGRLNAELLIGHALGLKRMQLYLQFERVLGEPELEKIRLLVRRRGKREPVQHIMGETDFCGLKLKTDRRALIPRPETERLVEIVLERWAAQPPTRVLDLGTGSGAIVLALANAWPGAALTAVDASEPALALARENAAATGLAERITFLHSDWLAQVPAEARFELIVANPPYLSTEETAQALPEVRSFEPVQALTGGEDGMTALREIMRAAPAFLAEGGMLALETGPAQHAELLRMASENGLDRAESLRDLTGQDRFLLARRRGRG